MDSKKKIPQDSVEQLNPVENIDQSVHSVVVEPRKSSDNIQNDQDAQKSEILPEVVIVDPKSPEEEKPPDDQKNVRRESVNPPKPNKTRLVMINYHQTDKYVSNHVTTAKYSVFSFLPFFLYEQFRRYSNIFFLGIALLQQIPDVSPTGRWTTLLPFLAILSVSAIKEIIEDVKRHRGDRATNNREVEVLRNEEFRYVKWNAVHVGEFVKVQNNHFFPADIVLFNTSEPLGVCYIETSNLDGETNLKVRQAPPQTVVMEETRNYVKSRGFLECGVPNRQIYEFAGSLKLETEPNVIPLGPDQLLLRGAKLRNTKWIIGLVIYSGFDTKLMKNSTKVPLKRSTLDKQTNNQIIMLFILLILIALMCSAFSMFFIAQDSIDEYVGPPKPVGTEGQEKASKAAIFFYDFLTFVILFNNLIPISLTVTLEVVRFIQALFINWDQDMYHLESDTAAVARTSNLNEELGQIRYIFSDKTGTLTRNVMEFKGCSVGGIYYDPETTFPPEDSDEESPLIKAFLSKETDSDFSANIREFLVLLAVCHNVIPEILVDYEDSSEDLVYHAASPDEKALVMGARQFGFTFVNRTPGYVDISVMGKMERYDILSLIEFTSTRKRMTVITKCPDGQIRLLCKGADSVIYERLCTDSNDTAVLELQAQTQAHLQSFATTGLRTLCCAMKIISEKEFADWNIGFQTAANSINDREEAIAAEAELIEKDLTLLGATAIEDKLQDFVPETIAAFLEAGIRVWVLTGDKQETAINIGYSCRLLTQSMKLLVMNQTTERHTSECISAYANELSISLCTFKSKKELGEIVTQNAAIIIDGKTLTFALMERMQKDFVSLCCNCKAVIVCRASPIQKAEIVESVTRLTGAVTLAIGDGANDVAMIQKAHVGVGISGNEGLQAAGASDYAIAQFCYLKKLLFVHGAWNHNRITKTVFYSFYKNICLYIIELWFAIYSAWSGQVIFERWTIGCYNMLFTCLQPIVLGIFDRNCSMKLRMENPILYHTSSGEFNLRQFFNWVINSLVHSVFLFWITLKFVGQGLVWPSGTEASYLVLGNFIYTYVVIVVSLKSGLVTSAWTKFTHYAIWGSILFWMLFLLTYSFMWHFSHVGSEISGVAIQVYTSPLFWIGFFIIPMATLMPDLAIKAIHGTFFRTPIDEFREEEICQQNRQRGEASPKAASQPQSDDETKTLPPNNPEDKSVKEEIDSIFEADRSLYLSPSLKLGPPRTKASMARRFRKDITKRTLSIYSSQSEPPPPVLQQDEEQGRYQMEQDEQKPENSTSLEEGIKSPEVLKYLPGDKRISRTSLVSTSFTIPNEDDPIDPIGDVPNNDPEEQKEIEKQPEIELRKAKAKTGFLSSIPFCGPDYP